MIGPLVVSTRQDDRRLALIKLKTSQVQQAVERIGKLYRANAPDFPFEYNFLDEKYDQLYKAEIKQESLLSIFSVIAICIACLGLFGLASYTAIKRTKEIGVRKVLGSSVENIVLLLSKDLLKPVLLGTIIAAPVGYFMMQKWLQGFAYRTTCTMVVVCDSGDDCCSDRTTYRECAGDKSGIGESGEEFKNRISLRLTDDSC